LQIDFELTDPPLDDGDRSQRHRDACFVGQLGFGLFDVFRPARYGASARAASAPDSGVTTGWPFGQGVGWVTALSLPNPEPRERVPVLLGLDDRDAWGNAELSMELEANATLDAQIVESGQLHCATGVENFQEGRYAQAHTGLGSPDPVQAWDLSSTHNVNRRGVGFVFLQANQAYHARVLQDGMTAWEKRGQPDGEFERVKHRLNLSPGPVAIQVPRLSSTDTAAVGYVLLDLPTWAAERFVEKPFR